MHKSIIWTAVPVVLDLTDVLKLIVDRFNQGSLPKENLVDQAEQPGLHVLAELGDQFDSLNPMGFEEFVAEVDAIAKELAEEVLGYRRDHPAIVNIARSEASNLQQFFWFHLLLASRLDDQRGLPAKLVYFFRNKGERAILVNSLIRSEGSPRAFSAWALLS